MMTHNSVFMRVQTEVSSPPIEFMLEMEARTSNAAWYTSPEEAKGTWGWICLATS